MSTWRIGVRSIGRNRRRTAVTTLAMSFAGVIMVFYAALLEGFMDTLERNALLMDIGEVQVHAEGYRKDPDLYKTVPEPSAVVAELEAAGLHAAPRLLGFGLAAAGASSAGVQLRGIDVPREAKVTLLWEHVRKGKWLDPKDPDGVVIGRKLAKTLGVKVGDEVVVVGQAADGSTANALYRVRGVLASISDSLDRGGFFMTEDAFRSLLVVPEGAHEVVAVRADRTHSLDAAITMAKASLPKLEVKGWREIQPVFAKMFETTFASQAFMLLITYAAVAMVVLNATLMSVFERVREFGVMRALGVTPFGVMQVVLLEVLTQASLAIVLAAAGGYGLSTYFETHGIDLSGLTNDASMMGIAFDPTWYTRVTPGTVLFPVLSLAVVVVLAAIYPGVKAAVIPPAEAMHHV